MPKNPWNHVVSLCTRVKMEMFTWPHKVPPDFECDTVMCIDHLSWQFWWCASASAPSQSSDEKLCRTQGKIKRPKKPSINGPSAASHENQHPYKTHRPVSNKYRSDSTRLGLNMAGAKWLGRGSSKGLGKPDGPGISSRHAKEQTITNSRLQ